MNDAAFFRTASSVAICIGTRPEIIKMAPVYHALRQVGTPVQLIHTGQHLEMARPMYEFFNMVPDFSLTLERRSDRLAHLSALLLEQLGELLARIAPQTVLVHGDTSSALMATLAAYYQQVPVGHVEAGLRSFNDYDPFPEEKNREIIGRLARWHFSPTKGAVQNLTREGIHPERISLVGNSIVDAVQLGLGRIAAGAKIEEFSSGQPLSQLAGILIPNRRLILVTAHRRENWGKPMASIAQAIRELLEADSSLCVVWPVHLNPVVADAIRHEFASLGASVAERLFLVAPISYPCILALLQRAWLVLTDSGGIQEEASCLRVPILVLRETTERPELLETGGGRLVGTERSKIVDAVRHLQTDATAYAAMHGAHNPFGDGRTADRIQQILSMEASTI